MSEVWDAPRISEEQVKVIEDAANALRSIWLLVRTGRTTATAASVLEHTYEKLDALVEELVGRDDY